MSSWLDAERKALRNASICLILKGMDTSVTRHTEPCDMALPMGPDQTQPTRQTNLKEDKMTRTATKARNTNSNNQQDSTPAPVEITEENQHADLHSVVDVPAEITEEQDQPTEDVTSTPVVEQHVQDNHTPVEEGENQPTEDEVPVPDPEDAFRLAWATALAERDPNTGAMPAVAEDLVRVAFAALPAKGNLRVTLPAECQQVEMATATADPASPDVSLMLAASRLVSLCAESAARRGAAASKPQADPLDVAADTVAALLLAAAIATADLDRDKLSEAVTSRVLRHVGDDTEKIAVAGCVAVILEHCQTPRLEGWESDDASAALLVRAEKLAKGKASGGARAASTSTAGGGDRGDVIGAIREHAATLADGVTLTVSELHALGIGASTGSVQHALQNAAAKLSSDGVTVVAGKVAKGRGENLVFGIRVERAA